MAVNLLDGYTEQNNLEPNKSSRINLLEGYTEVKKQVVNDKPDYQDVSNNDESELGHSISGDDDPFIQANKPKLEGKATINQIGNPIHDFIFKLNAAINPDETATYEAASQLKDPMDKSALILKYYEEHPESRPMMFTGELPGGKPFIETQAGKKLTEFTGKATEPLKQYLKPVAENIENVIDLASHPSKIPQAWQDYARSQKEAEFQQLSNELKNLYLKARKPKSKFNDIAEYIVKPIEEEIKTTQNKLLKLYDELYPEGTQDATNVYQLKNNKYQTETNKTVKSFLPSNSDLGKTLNRKFDTNYKMSTNQYNFNQLLENLKYKASLSRNTSEFDNMLNAHDRYFAHQYGINFREIFDKYGKGNYTSIPKPKNDIQPLINDDIPTFSPYKSSDDILEYLDNLKQNTGSPLDLPSDKSAEFLNNLEKFPELRNSYFAQELIKKLSGE